MERLDYKILLELESLDKKTVKYLVMDVDGTLTDGKIYMGQNGELCKAFNIKDGCGIHDIAIPAGITPIIITGRKSDIVLNRCKELGITNVYQGVSNKLEKLLAITSELSSVAYIGDDINDLPCMRPIKEAGGLVGCPADAVDEVKLIADYVCSSKGGDGCVREFIEWSIKNGKKIRVLQLLGGGNAIGGVEKMLLNYYSYMDRGKVQFDFCFYRESTFHLVKEEYKDVLESASIYELKLFDGKSSLSGYMKAIPRVIRIIKANNYDIVHINSGRSALLITGLIASILSGVKIRIAHSHSTKGKNNSSVLNIFSNIASSMIACFLCSFSTNLLDRKSVV